MGILNFLKGLFTIEGAMMCNEEFDMFEEEINKKEKKCDKLDKIIEILNEKEIEDITLSNNEVNENYKDFRKLLTFSFLSLKGSCAFSEDYEYANEHNIDFSGQYVNYSTEVTLSSNEKNMIIIEENGFNKREDKKVDIDAFIELVTNDYFDVMNF